MNESQPHLSAGLCIYRAGTHEVGAPRAPLEAGRQLIQKSSLEAGEHFFLFPRLSSPRALEEGLILEGAALCDGEPHPLTPGDAVLVEDADGPVVLTAQTRLALRHSPYQLSNALWHPEHLASRLARKDPQTTLHMARVRQLALAIGNALSLSSRELERLDSGAYFHDIGKLAVPTSILSKPGSLSIGEWRGVIKHTLYGREMLARTRLAAVAHIAEEHHERLDGSGYPYGLASDEVRLESYIVAVADSFDAMTHTRPYGRAKGLQQALSEMNRYAGVLYPSELVSALNAVVGGQFVCSSFSE